MTTNAKRLISAITELSKVWLQQIEVDPTDPYDEGYSTAKHECYGSLISVIREHGPELMKMLEDRSAELTTAWMAGVERERERAAEDSARLDYIERTFSGMTNRERYLPVQMIWGKGANGRTLREACDKYRAKDAARAGERGGES